MRVKGSSKKRKQTHENCQTQPHLSTMHTKETVSLLAAQSELLSLTHSETQTSEWAGPISPP